MSLIEEKYVCHIFTRVKIFHHISIRLVIQTTVPTKRSRQQIQDLKMIVLHLTLWFSSCILLKDF